MMDPKLKAAYLQLWRDLLKQLEREQEQLHRMYEKLPELFRKLSERERQK